MSDEPRADDDPRDRGRPAATDARRRCRATGASWPPGRPAGSSPRSSCASYDLGDRPFHHDESQDAYFSFTFFKDPGSYEYNPLLHGPVRFYLTGVPVLDLRADELHRSARARRSWASPVVGLPYLLRHQLGRVAAFAAAVMFAVGPSFLYFSRFAREDIYLAAITLAMVVAMFRFLDRPRTLTLCAAWPRSSRSPSARRSPAA